MANLAEASTWDTVYQLESTDQALAGAGGTMNRQAQALLNRTKFLADTKLDAADFKTQINASGDAPIYACRAWVNFNGAGTVSIRASGNVSSITDNALGDYTLNFTTAIQDANYAVSINAAGWASATTIAEVKASPADALAVLKTASQLRVDHRANGSATLYDAAEIYVSIFR